MHLAQLNVALLKHPQGDPRVGEFFNNLDLVNGIAERMPGFVWRLKDEAGNATSFAFSDNPHLIPNLSVWRSAEALETFVWKTLHQKFYARRAEWFQKLDGPHLAMWWIEEGHRPTLEDAHRRLETLKKFGPGRDAFGWEQLADAKTWRTARCA